MKHLPLFLVIFASTSAFAVPGDWLTCTTPGDALEFVSIGVDASTLPNAITYTSSLGEVNGALKSFGTASLSPVLADAGLASGHYELIFTTRASAGFSGAVTKAALLTLNRNTAGPNTYSGTLAKEGAVFTLSCKPTNVVE